MIDGAPIKSLAVISSFAQSLSNFRGPLVERLCALGIRVYALAPDFDSASSKTVRDLGAEPIDVSLQRTGLNPLRDIIDFVRLTRTLRRLKPDATFAYFIKPVIYGTLAARLAGVPRRFILVAGLGYALMDESQQPSLLRRLLGKLAEGLYGSAFRRCEVAFFQNIDDLQYFVNRGLIPEEKTVRLGGTGVALDRFECSRPSAEPLTFLMIARILREKGVVEYVAAARRLKARDPALRFVLVGGIDTNPGALSRREIQSWVDEGTIQWPGEVTDVRPWIRESSVYVLPSYREGVPRSTQEAMAMGRPIITTDAAGCRETVENGVNGYLVPVRDSAALADAMWKFAENPSSIYRMGLASRSLAERRFDVHEINRRILGAMGAG
jgi:glycosyltransferase involved in cell wall biosynthesis